MTGFGGLPVYLDLAGASGLTKAIDRNLKASSKRQGWTDRQVVMSLILLNLSGGDCVDDLNRMENDEGICRIIKRTEWHEQAATESLIPPMAEGTTKDYSFVICCFQISVIISRSFSG